MEPLEIAEKYVYGNHDALTDSQEIKDMVFDIEEYAKEHCAKVVNFGRLREASVVLSSLITSGAYDGFEIEKLVGISYEIVDELMRQGKCSNLK